MELASTIGPEPTRDITMGFEGEHIGTTIVVPKVSPEHAHAGKVSSRAFGLARPKEHKYNGFSPRELLAYIPDLT